MSATRIHTRPGKLDKARRVTRLTGRRCVCSMCVQISWLPRFCTLLLLVASVSRSAHGVVSQAADQCTDAKRFKAS